MKDKFFLLIGIAIVVWAFYMFLQKPAPARYQVSTEATSTTSVVKVGEESIVVELADTDAERILGLSGRESLESGHGLLFIFDAPGKYGIWMKDMNFPIDIVWVGENWQVVSVERLVNPDTYPNIFYPTEEAKYVLEIPAGESSRLGIDTGSTLYLESQK